MSTNQPHLDALPGLPRDAEGPVFEAPWQAHAFAMTLALNERGVFTWSEWATALSEEIRSAQRAGDSDRGDTYYDHWLKALEALVARKDITSNVELARYERAWNNAAQRTVHGAPIVLSHADFDR
jgi:nitrile hydratase accessory protein